MEICAKLITPLYSGNLHINRQRRNEVVLCRLRLGRTKLTPGYLMLRKDPPLHNTCVTVIECRTFLNQRRLQFASSPKLVILGNDEDAVTAK